MLPITRTAMEHTVSSSTALPDSHDAIARGITHDLNNIFSSLAIATHLLRENLSDERRDGLLASVARATERGRSLVDELSRHTERQGLETIPLDLEILVEAVTRAARRCLCGSISLQTEYESALPPVEGNPDDLFQLLYFLLEEIVARTPESGAVAIRCRRAGERDPGDRASGGSVEIEIEHSIGTAGQTPRIIWHQLTKDHVPAGTDVVQVGANRWALRLRAVEQPPTPRPTLVEPSLG